MRIAFYAPLKPPDHAVASGDRTMARLLLTALRQAGHEVEIAARLRSRDPRGEEARQRRLAALGRRLAARYVRRKRAGGEPPELWFTYHLYDKAADWIGPTAAVALGIPYVVAEASVAERRAAGPWRLGHAATIAALGQAAAIIGLNSADRAGVMPHLAAPERWHALPPFLETAPYAAARRARATHRARLAEAHRLDPAPPWLIAVAMMRPGDKLASYRLLAASLAALPHLTWRLLIVGDGAARDAVAAAFAPIADRIAWLGRRDPAEVAAALAASDLCVWPAINEAYGMALLEAQAAGLPVLAGASGGVGDIVAAGIGGCLVPPGDLAAFTAGLAALLAEPARLHRLGAAAAERAAACHDLAAASRRLDGILRGLVAPR